jgi:dihydrofolate synthase/folylpolyglutamate synthase
LDGAHNPDSSKRLTETLMERFPNQQFFFLASFLQTKLVPGIICHFLKTKGTFQFTSLPNHDTYKENDYKKVWEDMNFNSDYSYEENYVYAYQKLVNKVNKKNILCITGSLYLVGLMRDYFEYVPCSSYEQEGGG